MSEDLGLGRLRARFGCWPVVLALLLGVVGLVSALPDGRAADAPASALTPAAGPPR
jgi:hypothetical protein